MHKEKKYFYLFEMSLKIYFKISLLIFLFACSTTTDKTQQETNNSQFIDPFICTSDDHGQTDVAAAIPFGMVKPCPDTYPIGHSGYDYNSTEIIGFSHTRFSGVGCRGVGGNIRVLPFANSATKVPQKLNYLKNSEIAEAGYYSVILDQGIQVELTANNHVAFHKYIFPASHNSAVSIDLSSSFVEHVSEQHSFDKQGILSGKVQSSSVCKLGKYSFYYALWIDKNDIVISDKNSKVVFRFTTSESEEVNVLCALSVISEEAAIHSLENAKTQSFEKVRLNAFNKWNELLNVVQIETDDISKKQLFYTHLYHATQSPFLISEEDGSYRGSDGKVYKNHLKNYYHGWSIWDTFRSKLPLLSFLYPNKYKEMLASIAELYKQGKPVWGTETEPFLTIRTEHSIAILLDAHKKGLLPFSLNEIYAQLKEEAENLPFKSPDNILESSYDLWAMSEIATELGYHNEAKDYLNSAMNYQTTWKEKFLHMGETADVMHGDGLYEGTLWQYRWFVPFDIAGIQQLMGGKNEFEQQLDFFFKNELFNIGNQPDIQVPYLYAYTDSPWKTQALVYSLMNEQTNNWYGTHEKWKQPHTRKIFQNSPKGYVKEMDDDAGTMSAWYVWSALGFYPVFPGSPSMVISTPHFDSYTINFPNNTLKVETIKPTASSIYIQKMEIDGKPYNSCFISYNQLVQSKNIIIYLGDQPNKNWGK